jgi:hypothetical protein
MGIFWTILSLGGEGFEIAGLRKIFSYFGINSPVV